MGYRPFVVHVATLMRLPGVRQRQVRIGHLDDLVATCSEVPSGAEILVDVDMEAVHGGILVQGVIKAPWVAECRRCLEPINGNLRVDVHELFAEGDWREVEEGRIYLLSGEHLDLEPMVRDAVMLELPLAPVCNDACKGLCPSCGTNLNVSSCSCEAVVDSRFEVLRMLYS